MKMLYLHEVLGVVGLILLAYAIRIDKEKLKTMSKSILALLGLIVSVLYVDQYFAYIRKVIDDWKEKRNSKNI